MKKTLTVRQMASLGGHAKWAKLTKEQRTVQMREVARKAWITKRKNAGQIQP